MKPEQYIKDWLKELKETDFNSGLDNQQIRQIKTEIEVLECVLKDEVKK